MRQLSEVVRSCALVTRARPGALGCCRRLVAAVAARGAPGLVLVLIVDGREEEAYAALSSRSTHVVPFESLLPRHVLRLPGTGWWLRPGRLPVPTATLEPLWQLLSDRVAPAPVLVTLDPRVELPARFDPAAAARGGRWPLPRLRVPSVVGDAAHRAGRLAARLLDLPVDPRYEAWLPSPIAWWRREHLAGLRRRVRRVTGRSLEANLLAFGGPPAHVLYGLYVDRVLGAESGHYLHEGSALALPLAEDGRAIRPPTAAPGRASARRQEARP